MKTLLLGTALLAVVLGACGGGDSAALKAVKEDCLNPYGSHVALVYSAICRRALAGAYTGDSEAGSGVECGLLDVTLSARLKNWATDGTRLSGKGTSFVRDLRDELCPGRFQ